MNEITDKYETVLFGYVPGFDGRYVICSNGELFSMYRWTVVHGKLHKVNKIKRMKKTKDKHGYIVNSLHDNSFNKHSAKVHRLVADCFLSNPENKRCVCHKDNNPANNDVSNLYWGTDKENQAQAWEDGLHRNKTKVGKFTLDGALLDIYPSMSEAARKSNVPQSNIWKCVHKLRKSAGGYVWEKLD